MKKRKKIGLDSKHSTSTDSLWHFHSHHFHGLNPIKLPLTSFRAKYSPSSSILSVAVQWNSRHTDIMDVQDPVMCHGRSRTAGSQITVPNLCSQLSPVVGYWAHLLTTRNLQGLLVEVSRLRYIWHTPLNSWSPSPNFLVIYKIISSCTGLMQWIVPSVPGQILIKIIPHSQVLFIEIQKNKSPC